MIESLLLFKDLKKFNSFNLLNHFIQIAIANPIKNLDYKRNLFIKVNKIAQVCSPNVIEMLTPTLCKLFIYA
jgi:hypothetical protein